MTWRAAPTGGATWDVRPFARNDRFEQGVLTIHAVVGRLRQPLHGVGQPGGLGCHPGRHQHDGGRDVRMLKVLRPNPPAVRPRTAGTRTKKRTKGRSRGRREGAGAEPERIDRRPADDVLGVGSVWLTWNNNGVMQASGARVSGLGQVGQFSKRQDIPKSRNCSFGEIAIGPEAKCSRYAPRTRREPAPPSRPSEPPPIRMALAPKGSRPTRASRRPTWSSTTPITHSAFARSTPRPGWRGTPTRAARTSVASTCCGPTNNRTRATTRTSGSAHRTTRVSPGARRPVNDVTTNAQFLRASRWIPRLGTWRSAGTTPGTSSGTTGRATPTASRTPTRCTTSRSAPTGSDVRTRGRGERRCLQREEGPERD